jgi:hypothetical protein
VDLKTTRDASHQSFQRDIAMFRGRELMKYGFNYGIQASWYQQAVLSLGISPLVRFTFIAVETSPPYGITITTLDDGLLDMLRGQTDELFNRVARCKEKNEWPGYDACEALMTAPAEMEFTND